MNLDSCRRAVAGRTMLAALVGALVVTGGGFAYRHEMSRLYQYAGSAKLPAGTLGQLPLQIGNWSGRDVTMDSRVVQKTDADQVLSRAYDRTGTRQSVNLFIAYGVRFRDLLPHRPELCYPRAGWTLLSTDPLDVRMSDGKTLSCRLLHFRQGSLGSREIAVVHYYIIDGRCHQDVDALRRQAAGLGDEARYVVQVQVAGDPIGRGGQAIEELLAEFASEVTPPVIDLLSKALAAQSQPASTNPS